MSEKINVGKIEFPITTYREGAWFVSEVPVLHVASQGKTVEESVKNVKEAVEVYFEGEDVVKILKEKLFH